MASIICAFLALALGCTAVPQQYNYYPYPPPQPQSRADYGRAIARPLPPYPQAFYQQQQPSPSPYFGQQIPESIQTVPLGGYPYQPVPSYGFLPENIFKQAVEQDRYLTPPSLKFKIGVVSGDHFKRTNKDEDTGNFKAHLLEGFLYIQQNKENPETPNITLEFNVEKDLHTLESGINFADKGFELSTLNVFNGKLYACDDVTGILYEIKKIVEEEDEEKSKEGVSGTDGPEFAPEDKDVKGRYVAEPWLILANEGQNRGFQCEWAVVKENKLWIGSDGTLEPKDKDSTEFSKERQFVKVIDSNGEINTLDWTKYYEKIAEAYEVNLRQGQVVHEAVTWSETLGKWVIIPRRVTKEKKDEGTWNSLATNEGLITDDKFGNLKTQKLGNLTESNGVVGLRFIPGTQDKFILTLKAGEDKEGKVTSKLSVLDSQGKEVMPETSVGDNILFTAVEFL